MPDSARQGSSIIPAECSDALSSGAECFEVGYTFKPHAGPMACQDFVTELILYVEI